MIEHGVWQLEPEDLELEASRAATWCTAIRDGRGQIPRLVVSTAANVLRADIFCDNTGMVLRVMNGKWWLKIPASLFKNEKSAAFKDLTLGGFYVVTLEDEWGLYTDLDTYVREARDGFSPA